MSSIFPPVISTKLLVIRICVLYFQILTVLCLRDGIESSGTSNSTVLKNQTSLSSDRPLSLPAYVHLTDNVIVIPSMNPISLEMGESTELRLAISVACDSGDVEHSFALESYAPSVAYFPANEKTSFTLSCKYSEEPSKTRESLSKFYHQFYDGVAPIQRDTTPQTAPNYPETTPGMPRYDVSELSQDDRDVRDPKNIVILSTLPRVNAFINVTIAGDLLGRSWLLVTSNTTSTSGYRSWDGVTALGSKGQGNLDNTNKSKSSDDVKKSSNFGDVAHEIPIVVLRNLRPIDVIFRAVLYFFVAFSSVAMGCKTDLSVVKKVLKRPVAPGLGFVAQYVFMPLIAFAMSMLVTFDNPAVRLGIFTCGVCPGGGASNIFSYLLKGDLSLSVTMTCISSVFALAMIPIWMFTLGQRFNDDKITIQVPFLKIMESLSIVILPLFVGFFLNLKCPKIAGKIQKVVKPLSIITIVFILTVGVYSNLYLFRLFQLNTVLAACLLPYIGYILGGCLALISCQPWERVKTIAIETGIQNTTVAYLMLTFSLPAPDSDLAAVGSAASALMTPLPLLLISIVYVIYRKRKKMATKAEVTQRLNDEERDKSDDVDDENFNMTKYSDL